MFSSRGPMVEPDMERDIFYTKKNMDWATNILSEKVRKLRQNLISDKTA